MKNSTRKTNSETAIDSDMASDASVSHESRDMLSEIFRDGARKITGVSEWAFHRVS
jgi:hypothetical protein